jgi:hypothetical protein
MRELVNQRATVTFGVLVLITGISFWLTVGHGGANLHQTGSLVWTLVIVLAALKVRWVLMDFMEVRSAPVKLRLLCEAWVVGLTAALVLINWFVA